jgi:hypothetical protein
MSYKIISKKIVIPFNDIEITKIYTQAIKELYKNEIYRLSSKLKFDAKSQLENGDDVVLVYSSELSLYNLTDKIFETVNKIKQDDKTFNLKKKLQHREVKRLVNWLARGDFYGEFSDPSEVLIGKESFVDIISTVFIDALGDLKDYNLKVIFLDNEEMNKSGKKKEGNIIPVVELRRKISSWTSVGSNKNKIKLPVIVEKPKKQTPYLEKIISPKKNELEKFFEITGDILIKGEDIDFSNENSLDNEKSFSLDKLTLETGQDISNEKNFSNEKYISSGLTPIVEKINVIIPENPEINKFLKLKANEKKINEKILGAFLINGIDINQKNILLAINDAARMVALELE